MEPTPRIVLSRRSFLRSRLRNGSQPAGLGTANVGIAIVVFGGVGRGGPGVVLVGAVEGERAVLEPVKHAG